MSLRKEQNQFVQFVLGLVMSVFYFLIMVSFVQFGDNSDQLNIFKIKLCLEVPFVCNNALYNLQSGTFHLFFKT